jgi:hypothetical protein
VNCISSVPFIWMAVNPRSTTSHRFWASAGLASPIQEYTLDVVAARPAQQGVNGT